MGKKKGKENRKEKHLDEEGLGQSNTHAPTTRVLDTGLAFHLLYIKLKAGQDGRGSGLCLVGLNLPQPLINVLLEVERRRKRK